MEGSGLEARAHELLGFGFLVGDGTQVIEVNDTAATIFGRTTDELLAMGSVQSLLHPEDARRIALTVEDRRATGRTIPERFTARVVRPDGSTIAIELWVKAEVDGDLVRTYTILHEIGGFGAVRDGLAHLALTDPLTNLPNRLALEEHLRMALSRLERHPAPGMLLFLDLDGLKQINDEGGHAAGDKVLRAFASRLAGAIRSGDTAARLGGDEFVVLIPELEGREADELLDRIQAATTFVLEVDRHAYPVSASVGAVALDDPTASRSWLIARADDRMYTEKRRRRARR